MKIVVVVRASCAFEWHSERETSRIEMYGFGAHLPTYSEAANLIDGKCERAVKVDGLTCGERTGNTSILTVVLNGWFMNGQVRAWEKKEKKTKNRRL